MLLKGQIGVQIEDLVVDGRVRTLYAYEFAARTLARCRVLALLWCVSALMVNRNQAWCLSCWWLIVAAD